MCFSVRFLIIHSIRFLLTQYYHKMIYIFSISISRLLHFLCLIKVLVYCIIICWKWHMNLKVCVSFVVFTHCIFYIALNFSISLDSKITGKCISFDFSYWFKLVFILYLGFSFCIRTLSIEYNILFNHAFLYMLLELGLLTWTLRTSANFFVNTFYIGFNSFL